MATAGKTAPLTDSTCFAVARLVDDSQEDKKRSPSHSDLTYLFGQTGLSGADIPRGTPAGKERRVRQVLGWALEHDSASGERMLALVVDHIRSCGGFRTESPNFVGTDALANAQQAFTSEGFELTSDGDLHPRLLSTLNSPETPEVLRQYARRANKGAMDAALVAGTGKDLMEATAAYVLVYRFGEYNEQANFPTLLGQAFVAMDLATPNSPEPATAWANVERHLFEAGCAMNRLRNREGTGHGRPFLPGVTEKQAAIAVQTMGTVAQLMLDSLPDA